MPSKPLKTFIRHLFESDSEFRAFLAAPDRMLDSAAILPEERQALLRWHRSLSGSDGTVGAAPGDSLMWP